MHAADAGLFRFTCRCGFKGFYDFEITVFIEKMFRGERGLHAFVDNYKLRQIIKLARDFETVRSFPQAEAVHVISVSLNPFRFKKNSQSLKNGGLAEIITPDNTRHSLIDVYFRCVSVAPEICQFYFSESHRQSCCVLEKGIP
jgi:hypothetical protein